MTDALSDSDNIETTAFSQVGIRAILAWMGAPPSLNAADELTALHIHLGILRTSTVTPQQRALILDRLYTRCILVVSTLIPTLTSVALPIPRKTRLLIRSLQDLLRALAEDLLTSLNNADGHLISGLRQPHELTLWRSLHALAQHLLIGNLAASPAGVGIWQQLHQAYAAVLRLELSDNTPDGTSSSLQSIYFSAILLGCAQPASFTSREISFVATYLERFAERITPDSTPATPTPATFWIDPARDAPAVACSRKSAPPETPVLYFSCDRVAELLREQLAALDSGVLPAQIGLPDFAVTPAGRGVLRRLQTYWGDPGKRRFPRRRQNYRAALCAGLGSLWRLFQDGDETPIDSSSWMITNESPDGYAVMHVSGTTGAMSVGDVTAIRTESGNNWQICIVRWALSENQEHLELGLQILATRAIPAFLALPAGESDGQQLSVLVLPKIPALRSSEMLVIPSGTLGDQLRNFVLIVEKDNLEVREMKSTRLDEQNSQIEIFSIEPDTLAA